MLNILTNMLATLLSIFRISSITLFIFMNIFLLILSIIHSARFFIVINFVKILQLQDHLHLAVAGHMIYYSDDDLISDRFILFPFATSFSQMRHLLSILAFFHQRRHLFLISLTALSLRHCITDYHCLPSLSLRLSHCKTDVFLFLSFDLTCILYCANFIQLYPSKTMLTS